MRLCNIYNKEINKKKKESKCSAPPARQMRSEGRISHVFEGHIVPYIYIFNLYTYFMYLTPNLHLSYTHLVYECINPLKGADFGGGLIDAIPPTFSNGRIFYKFKFKYIK